MSNQFIRSFTTSENNDNYKYNKSLTMKSQNKKRNIEIDDNLNNKNKEIKNDSFRKNIEKKKKK